VQRLHGLLDRRVRIKAMDLIQIDVLGPQARQGRVDLLQDRLARQALPARAVVHPAEQLGGQDDVLAP